MAKQSEYTKTIKTKFYLYLCLDIGLLFLPVFIYVIMALRYGGVTTTGKVSVVTSVLIALVLSVFNFFRQKKLRSPIWIICIGLYVAVKEWLLPLIIILAVTTTIDDLLLGPLVGYYKVKLITNKTIDERQEAEQVQPARE